jgi:hypothetical protein
MTYAIQIWGTKTEFDGLYMTTSDVEWYGEVLLFNTLTGATEFLSGLMYNKNYRVVKYEK